MAPQAIKDLEAIENYYLDIAPEYASIFVNSVFERTQALSDMPYLGRIVPEVGDRSVRELIHQGYRIMYVVNENDDAEILTVLHSTQQFGGTRADDG